MCTITANAVGVVFYVLLALGVSIYVGINEDDFEPFFFALIVFVVVGVFMFVPFSSTSCHDVDCQCIECHAHADDCQCNECVIRKCEAINHGDTCQCDKCLECKNIGGN